MSKPRSDRITRALEETGWRVSQRPKYQSASSIAASGRRALYRVLNNAEPKFVFRPGKRSSISNPLFEGFDDDRDRPRYDETVFLRLGASESELLSGYPATPEELFKFDLLIWGDVKRGFFNTTQFEVTRDFVEKRGGFPRK